MAGERVPLGGVPGPRPVFGLGLAFTYYGLLPQLAWLDGSVLAVEGKRGVRRCDLATASKIKIRSVPDPLLSPWSLMVLHACQEAGSRPVRLVLTAPDWVLLTAGQLRTLRHIIGSRPGEPGRKINKALWRLDALASYQDLRTKPIDWSFRTDPQGHRRPSTE